ncbi:sacsin N-terminal ATP-binding-like domain-containing protein [Pseudarthrobacter sp. S6]|uniref:sacsin N-terminal ATP-binding-like domain-containing protein n=1 Tax=Pseudarthrobacter sp. S6 TaxID=3418420 RepID=UPI003CF8CF0F
MDVTTRLREQELASIRVQVDHALRESALKSLDERGGAQELVRQQYTGRYPFELLQNANDAARDTGTRGRAHFLLTDTALIVADNGSGFGDPQVEAICSLGRSSKGPGESVGHKGLGFKSVGEITDHPQIVSALSSFQFNGERVSAAISELLGSLPARQKLPIYAFPFGVEQADLGPDAAAIDTLRASGFTTVIRLPFRDSVERSTVEADLLENLASRLLLFLPHVDHLELEGTYGDFSSEIVRNPDGDAEHVLLETNSHAEEWFIYRGSVAPDPVVLEPLGESWKDIDEVRFAIAVPVDGDGQPRVDETFPLHVYFPTDEQPGLHMAVHAEWMLSMDRRQIATTPEAGPFNRMLVRAMADHLRSTVAPDLVRRTQASSAAIEALVPATNPPAGAGGTAIRKHWTEALLDSPFLPAADGSLRRPADIRLLPRSLPDPANAHGLTNLDPGHTLRPDVERLIAIKTFLTGTPDTGEMGIGEFIALLLAPTRETAEDYYRFLAEWREAAGTTIVNELKKAPIVLGTGGQMLTPTMETIFFPRERSEVTIPEELPVPIAFVPDAEDAQKLLRDLGIKPFEWRELIREFLIKILSDPEADPHARAGAMAGLRAYRQVRLQGNEDIDPVLGRVLLPARTADGAVHELRPAAEIYFSAPWSDSDELEVIYGPFGDVEFLDIEPPVESEGRQDDFDFYRMLGVVAYPRLDVAKPAETYGYMVVNSGRHPHRGGLFREWIGLPEVKVASQCPQGHTQSQQLRESYRLDRLEEVMASKEPVRLMALWNQLARRWGSVYEGGLETLFYCLHGSHVGDRGRPAASLFAYTLRSRPWVPVDRGNMTELVRPSEAWIEAAQTPRRIQERIPRISEAMFQAHGGAGLAAALHLTDAGRPRVADLLVLLESIANEADAAGHTNRELYQAARWVQRTLHDVLRDETETHPEPEIVRLLASQDGVIRFVAQPPYADDPLLRDTFEKQRPLLSAEAGLTKLTRYLALTRLDDAVTTSALPFGEDHGAAYDHVGRRINSIKPYLFALVRAENSSAENRVRSALQRLELVVCERLGLTYEYDGTEVFREEAVCYIASRSEKRGGRTVNVGTAYLELDPASGQPHWFPLGRQLAQYLIVPTLADAFTMLLTASPDDRQRMMADRQIQPHDVTEARQLLNLAPEDEEELTNVLDSLLLEPSEDDEDKDVSPGMAALATNRAGGISEQVPDTNSNANDPIGNEPAEDAPAAANEPSLKAPPPPVDFSAVSIVDGVAGNSGDSGATKQNGYRGGVRGGHSTAPSIHTEQENRRIGKRGEEVAYHAERHRLKTIRKNPDSVRWVSKLDELSPYDMTSVDEDDQVIYIEVKATKGTDPTEAFYISRGELIEATVRRSRYYIYRVTDVDASVPTITRWGDPLGLINDGKGHLLLAKAHMALTLADDA